MRVKAAKYLTGGREITKVVVADLMASDEKLVKSSMILLAGRYHEDGDSEEEGFVLSTVLKSDVILELWTAEGKAWDAGITNLDQIYTD